MTATTGCVHLSPQQVRVAAGVRRGHSYGEIAAAMGITRRTVCAPIQRAARKIENPDGLKPYLAVFKWAQTHNGPSA